jgi:hypothetical protein
MSPPCSGSKDKPIKKPGVKQVESRADMNRLLGNLVKYWRIILKWIFKKEIDCALDYSA